MNMRRVVLLSAIFLIAGSCIPEKNGIPFENFRSYAFEMVEKENILGVGHLMFLIEDQKGFIIYNLFSQNQKGGKTPVSSFTELLEVSQLEERSAGLYIVTGKHIRGYPVVGTVRKGPSGFPYLENMHHADFQLTIQKDTHLYIRPLSKEGMKFYNQYLKGIDIGASPVFTEYKYSN